jgi:hypothetical protein
VRSFPYDFTSLRFDVLTYGSSEPGSRSPGPENAPQRGQRGFQIGRFLLQEFADMAARRGPSSAQVDDLPNVSERESEAASLPDECEQTKDVSRVTSVTGWSTAGRRQDPARLVESQRLAAQAASRRHFADQETLVHEGRIEPAPWGKVKSFPRRRVYSEGAT